MAIRWNHKQLAEFLLESVAWTEAEVRQAVKMEGLTQEYRLILKVYCKRRFNCLFNFCLCI